MSQCPQITIFTFEFQLFKFLNMKIMRTAPDVFNIYFVELMVAKSPMPS